MEKTISKKYIYKGKIVNLRLDRVRLPSGELHTREIVEHRGSVAILPVTSKKEIFLVKQFRKAVGKEIWEVPAGRIEEGESIEECARRELKEETGLLADEIKKLGEYYPSPGYCTEVIHIYLARNLKKSNALPEKDEFIKLKKFSKGEIVKMIEEGEIKDGKTYASLLLFLLKEGGIER